MNSDSIIKTTPEITHQTTIDIDLLKNDFYRFALLHSWYKHLPLEIDFVFIFSKGQQETQNTSTDLNDPNPENFHWHFYRKDRSILYVKKLLQNNVQVFEARFGSFLQGLDRFGNFQGFHLMPITKYDYLSKKYPEYEKDLFAHRDNFYSF